MKPIDADKLKVDRLTNKEFSEAIENIKAEINEIKANALHLYRTSPSEQTRKMASEKSYTCDDILRSIDREINKAIKAKEPVQAYKCDPNKNTECKKTGCFERGGPCELTLNPKYAKEEQNEHNMR